MMYHQETCLIRWWIRICRKYYHLRTPHSGCSAKTTKPICHNSTSWDWFPGQHSSLFYSQLSILLQQEWEWASQRNPETSDNGIVSAIFLAATKQLYESFSPSVCLWCLFHYVPIIVSSWNFQELLPMTRVMCMQKVKVRGQRSRSQRSQSNLTVSWR